MELSKESPRSHWKAYRQGEQAYYDQYNPSRVNIPINSYSQEKNPEEYYFWEYGYAKAAFWAISRRERDKMSH